MRWILTYIIMASVGLWLAFFMSLRFMAPAHSQTPPPPTAADLPPEFAEQTDQVPAPPEQRTVPPGSKELGRPEVGPVGQPPEAPARIPPPPTEPPQTPTGNANAPAPEPVPPETEPTTDQGSIPVANPEFAGDDQYVYESAGRRDPFKPYRNYRPPPVAPGTAGPGGAVGPNGAPLNRVDPLDPLQRWDVNRFTVMAIIWEVRSPKAMIKDPDGATYMIGKGTKIGRNGGYVITIREGEVVIVETIDTEGVVTKEVRILELKK